MTNCKSFCQYRGPFFLSSNSSTPLLFLFVILQPSPLFPPASYLALQSLNTTQSLFFFFFFSPTCSFIFPPRRHFSRPVSVVPSRASAATNQVPHSSRVISVTQSWKTCTLSPLLSSVSADSHLSTPSSDEQIRSELGQVTQWRMNGRWPWVRIYGAS